MHTALQYIKNKLILLLAAFVLLPTLLAIFSGQASAAQITARKVTLSTSSAAAATATTTYTLDFTVPSATVLQSFEAIACTTASGTCTIPTGFSVSAATLASQPTNLGDASGWTVNIATAGKLRAVKSGNVAAPTGAQTVVFGNVQNPTTANQTFYLRMTTYSDAAWTTAVDAGTVAGSTSLLMVVTATVDETLVFCTGTSGITSSSCAGATGTAVALGNLSTTTTGSGTSQIGVATNAGTGYAITVNGTTLTSTVPADTITALAAQAVSSVGTKQFGINLVANTTPSVGSNVAGAGTATATATYATVDQYRFVTGDSIASKATSDDFRLFTVSYIANISNITLAGNYTTTLTYICTATF